MKARSVTLAALLAGCLAQPVAAQVAPPSLAPLPPLAQCETDRDALAKTILALPEPPSRVLWASVGAGAALLFVILVRNVPVP